jgi:hypothetical protein
MTGNQKSEIVEILTGLQKSLLEISSKHDFKTYQLSKERLSRWKERIVNYLERKVSPEEAKRFSAKFVNTPKGYMSADDLNLEIKLYNQLLQALIEDIESNPFFEPPSFVSQVEQTLTYPSPQPETRPSPQPEPLAPDTSPPQKHCVFIGHGRSAIWARLQLYLENELGLKTVNYESESRVGDSIVPILEKMLSEATFAILILTAEDETAVGEKRARQNVIHEAGLFQGKLGFRKTVLLRQEGVEEFSNVAGLQYVSFNGDRIDQTFWELQRVLKREGILK